MASDDADRVRFVAERAFRFAFSLSAPAANLKSPAMKRRGKSGPNMFATPLVTARRVMHGSTASSVPATKLLDHRCERVTSTATLAEETPCAARHQARNIGPLNMLQPKYRRRRSARRLWHLSSVANPQFLLLSAFSLPWDDISARHCTEVKIYSCR